ncbi:MAG: guanine deaminase [Rhodospirillaceae bacterium]|nr:guanine deaminase [Rhodospirillaceae bacterium]OUT79119.1 MAG: guanine deaminase [Rhodospirillaceae bacterium TMED23]|tara:strand:- start:50 stop:1339 length:1290 start_codon:yes stop_codon:yes gene_type:complete
MEPSQDEPLVLRGKILTFKNNKLDYEYWEKGVLLIEKGFISQVGNHTDINYPQNSKVIDFGQDLIVPGFIDGHVHYPQMSVIGSYGKKLIDWLNDYTYPEEIKFSSYDYAQSVARLFLSETLKNGYTTSSTFCTVHPGSVDALFYEAQRIEMRVIAGKVLMDRHAPDSLLDTAQESFDDSQELINKWHNNGRGLYAVTPRFAPTSTPDQLEVAGALFSDNDNVYLQSHVSEQLDEVDWVADLFPESSSYLDVYNSFSLLGKRALYGHGIYFSESDIEIASATDTTIIHCPTSNLFLGSGLFQYEKLKDAGIRLGLGTDIGGGTSLSPFATMKAAYEIAQFNNYSLSPLESFYRLTFGGAHALHLENKIGQIKPGFEADLTIIDLSSTDIIKNRMRDVEDLSEMLFTQIMLADDRAIRATFVNGKLVYEK